MTQPPDWIAPHENCAGEDDTLSWWGIGFLAVIALGFVLADIILAGYQAVLRWTQR